MKYLFYTIILVFICSCNKIYNCEKDCPEEIIEKRYCELFDEAKWCFYASNSFDSFEYKDTLTGKLIDLKDVLSIDLQYRLKEYNDTVEFNIWPTRKYNCFIFKQSNSFCLFGFDKKTKKLIYREKGNTSGISKKTNGNIFYFGDKIYLMVDSAFKNSKFHAPDMREYGLYPIDEQNQILIDKIKSGRKDINQWLLDYARYKGYIK